MDDTNERVREVEVYEPPTITVLGTVAELTLGEETAFNGDTMFGGDESILGPLSS